MHTINNFIFEYLFLPSAMLAYAVFMTMLIRSTISDWRKEREQKRKEKNTESSNGQ